MMRPRHLGAHMMTVGGFSAAVWWVGNLWVATTGMLACLFGIAWWVWAQCRDEAA